MAETSAFLKERLPFPVPTRETHAGIPLSNATFGALVGSEGRNIRITINRADYWDHRGGLEFGPDATYANLRGWLEEGNEERLREVFEGKPDPDSGTPPRPTRLPMGRIDLQLPPEWSVVGAGLHLLTGEAELELEGPRSGAKLRASILRDAPVLCLRITGLEGAGVKVNGRPPDVPAVLEHFRKYGFPPAQPFDHGQFGGWVQECPGEPAMCVGWLRHDSPSGLLLYAGSVYGENPAEARKHGLQTLESANSAGYTPATLRSFSWWRKWWSQAPSVRLPDPELELLYYLGMYKLAGLSVPGSPAATLQGPWVEDHRLPPWSGDYHFNINVQECYWPAFAGNHLESLDPLVEMLRSWQPRLRENARAFVGIQDGLQLPHSTDDRGQAMSGFWTGFVDHGCTGWVAQLLWQRYLFTLDRAFLEGVAYPFLKGATRVYEAMLEDDGRQYSLPVGVSPEYGGKDFRACGRNASFQLAVIHFLCQALVSASETLRLDAADRERWADIDRRLPLGAVADGELLLWEGQPLAESHRHHSHLAGLYPFDVLDPHTTEQHKVLIRGSLQRWTRMGAGQWTGWCYPWASILHARLGNGEMASLLLRNFRQGFMGPGYFSTHDARFPGLSAFDSRPDVMQVEAAEGAAAAVLEMLAHSHAGILRIFPAIPSGWSEVAFSGIRTEGAFLVSADREGGRAKCVRIQSEAGAALRIANPWYDGPVQITRPSGVSHQRGRILDLPTAPGEILTLEQRLT